MLSIGANEIAGAPPDSPGTLWAAGMTYIGGF